MHGECEAMPARHNNMRQAVMVNEVETTERSDSGLSRLARTMLKAAAIKTSVSPEANVQARNATRAALHKALQPGNQVQYEYRNYGAYSIFEPKL